MHMAIEKVISLSHVCISFFLLKYDVKILLGDMNNAQLNNKDKDL